MNIIYILIPLGLLLLLFAVAAFFWAVRSGQFDDLESPAWRVVLDDARAPPAADTPETTSEQASQDDSPPG